jgi:hypothetical protein
MKNPRDRNRVRLGPKNKGTEADLRQLKLKQAYEQAEISEDIVVPELNVPVPIIPPSQPLIPPPAPEDYVPPGEVPDQNFVPPTANEAQTASVQYVAHTTLTPTNQTTITLSFTVPAARQANDFLVAIVSYRSNDGTDNGLVAPTGFVRYATARDKITRTRNNINSANPIDYDTNVSVWVRKDTGGNISTLTFSRSNTNISYFNSQLVVLRSTTGFLSVESEEKGVIAHSIATNNVIYTSGQELPPPVRPPYTNTVRGSNRLQLTCEHTTWALITGNTSYSVSSSTPSWTQITPTSAEHNRLLVAYRQNLGGGSYTMNSTRTLGTNVPEYYAARIMLTFCADAPAITNTEFYRSSGTHYVHVLRYGDNLNLRRNINNASILMVGGGGGGFGDQTGAGGGGGGGGVVTFSGLTILSGDYQVGVGKGGRGGFAPGNPVDRFAENGGDTTLSGFDFIALGGGGAGGGNASSGGSGGGGGTRNTSFPGGGGFGNQPLQPPNFGNGFSGGFSFGYINDTASVADERAGGGGGGGTQSGTNGSREQGGKGGNGVSSTISGSTASYGAGGGGGGLTGGGGGTGGGGIGSWRSSGSLLLGDDGQDDRGSGGGGVGGASAGEGGRGGDGVIIIRYPI